MPGTIEVPKSEQAQNYAALLTDLNNAVARFGELTPKMEAQFKAHAEDIAKLRDTVSAMERTSEQRFAAVLQRVTGPGGEAQLAFGTRERQAAIGRILIAAAGRRAAAQADLELAAINPTPDASGGYLIPEQLMMEIVRNVNDAGVFERDCPAIPVSVHSGSWPRRTAGNTVYYPAFGSAATASAPTFGAANWTLVRHCVLTLVDRWMLASDLAIALAQYVAEEAAYALAVAEDTNWFVGDGTSTYGGYTGLFKDTSTLSVGGDSGDDTFSELIADSSSYLATCLGTLPLAFHAGAKWYMHPVIFFGYMGIKDTGGMPIASIYASANGPGLGLMGKPVELVAVATSTTAVSTTMLVLANLRRACRVVRHRSAGEVRVSDQYKFAEGQTAFLLDIPQDRTLVDPNGVVRLITAAS